jgi:AcrR family transcriptional regulator
LRDRVLDAIGELLRERAFSEVTMSDVAARAGVSRQTLYNSFGSRAQLARVYIAREADGFLRAVNEAIRAHPGDPARALTVALEGFLAAAGSHPLIRAITSPDGTPELLPLVTTRGGQLVEAATEQLCGSILEVWPGVARRDARALSEALVRLAISYAALPAGPPRETAARVACLLHPAIERMLATLERR